MADNLYKYITTDGVIVPNTADVQAEVQQEYRDLFGAGLSVEESTPQGRMIEVPTATRKQVMGICAFEANQLNPQKATGKYLETHGSFFDVKRENEVATRVYCKLSGVPPTIANGTIQIAVNVVDGVYISIGDEMYTFGTDGVAIGSTAAISATNLANAINATGDSSVSATASGNVIEITAKTVQAYGNTDSLNWGVNSESDTTEYIILSGTSLSGGTVIIPAGSQAEDTAGNIYVIAGETALGSDGTAYAVFSNLVAGAIPCAENTLTIPLNPVSGWEGITNPSVGTIGYLAQSDASYRRLIDKSKTKYSQGAVRSIEGALYAINGLQSYVILENPTGDDWNDQNPPPAMFRAQTPPTGETLESHSVMIWVYGASMDGNFYQDVANAIIDKKSSGCGESAVVDENYVHIVNGSSDSTHNRSNQVAIFNVPAPLPIYISAQVKNVSDTGENLIASIKEIIVNWFAGNLTGSGGVGIGEEISAFQLSCVISSNIGVRVNSLLVGTSPNNLSINTIPVQKNQIATISSENINIGQIF